MPFLPPRSSAAARNHHSCSHRCSSALTFVTSEEKVVVAGPFFSSPTLSRACPLTGARLRMGSPAPLPLPPSFLAHEHRTASLSLPCTSSHRVMAGDASPTTTHTAALPCTAVAGFPCSLAHAMGTVGFARGWGARRSPSPGLRPRRRRDLGGPPPPLSREAGSWGRLTHGGHYQPQGCEPGWRSGWI